MSDPATPRSGLPAGTTQRPAPLLLRVHRHVLARLLRRRCRGGRRQDGRHPRRHRLRPDLGPGHHRRHLCLRPRLRRPRQSGALHRGGADRPSRLAPGARLRVGPARGLGAGGDVPLLGARRFRRDGREPAQCGHRHYAADGHSDRALPLVPADVGGRRRRASTSGRTAPSRASPWARSSASR